MRGKKSPIVTTFSIVGRDPGTGEMGVAVQSKFLAVGALVPWAEAEVGAVATQSMVNTTFGTRALSLMKAGHCAEKVRDMLISDDPDLAYRQFGIVDAQGGSATFTGDECFEWAGGVNGPDYCCQGNILVGRETVLEMEAAFLRETGDLARRLLSALDAGGRAGGDRRGKQSAAILIVKKGAGYGGLSDRYIDLRVDDHPDPIAELIRLHHLHQLYFYKTDPERIITIQGKVKSDILEALTAMGYYSGEPHEQWTGPMQEALKQYSMMENFEERMVEAGRIDEVVYNFMIRQFKERTT